MAGLGLAAAEAWRELVITLAAAARGPVRWSAGMATLRQRRELGLALARSAPLPRPPADAEGTARRVAQLAAALAVVAVLLVVSVALPSVGEPAFLAGLFDALGEWWNDLPLWAQLLIPFAVAGLLTFAGMGFLPVLGVVSTFAEVAAAGQGIATFVRNPSQATRDFFRDLTPTQALGLLAGLALERVLPATLGGLLGTTGRTTVRRTTDDLTDTLDENLYPGRRNPTERGALGPDFSPGVHDPDNLLLPKERGIADLLASEGYDVRPRPADHTVQGQQNPDVLVRRTADDPGIVTEFKTLERTSSTAVKNSIIDAGKQIEGDSGQVVIDGRSVGLSEDAAMEGVRRALGQASQHGQAVPGSIRIILGDGRVSTTHEGHLVGER